MMVLMLFSIKAATESLYKPLQLLSHLETMGQLHQDHLTYIDILSTTSVLLHITDAIYKATDRNEITATMSVDQTATFDCCEHDLLLRKLPYYNIGSDTSQWIRSYLSNFVTVGDKNSVKTTANSGVPQGSGLGPLLYLIYMNELPESVSDVDNSHNGYVSVPYSHFASAISIS